VDYSSHTPVLLDEILNLFSALKLSRFVDCTLGAGGHAEALLRAHPELQNYIGIDQDPLARTIAAKRLRPWQDKVSILKGNFRQFTTFLPEGSSGVDGVLMDLGVSSMQLDLPEKGFSFMQEGPLDMRMDPEASLTAAEILNVWSEEEIGHIFRDCGEEKSWKAAARAVVSARKHAPLTTTQELASVLYPVLSKKPRKGINPLTLVFQGLRIFVNRELEVLKEVLPQIIHHLRSGGRLAVISFHSLEDRVVKHFFQHEAADKEDTSGIGGLFLDKVPTVRIITKKPIVPTEAEIARNPRSRSAKLRVVEKL
jgi:16S rRNA (cytosine1402-N4)-methyltransferase